MSSYFCNHIKVLNVIRWQNRVALMYFPLNYKNMTKLSVNVNKIATLRNARGGNVPNLLSVSQDLEKMGAQGITIHPRPDERHIRYQDARDLNKIVTTEFNIEGNPIQKFIDLVLEIKPTQVTLVPDAVTASLAMQDGIQSLIKVFCKM